MKKSKYNISNGNIKLFYSWIIFLVLLIVGSIVDIVFFENYKNSLYYSAYGNITFIVFYISAFYGVYYFLKQIYSVDSYLFVSNLLIFMHGVGSIEIDRNTKLYFLGTGIKSVVVFENSRGEILKNKLIFFKENRLQIENNFNFALRALFQ